MNTANYLRYCKPVVLHGFAPTPSQALKYAWWFEKFRKQLSTGKYRFSYFKIDCSIREAIGTLDPTLIPANRFPTSGDKRNVNVRERFTYYDLECNAWRSFRIEGFIGFVEKVE